MKQEITNTLIINGSEWEFDKSILDSAVINDKVIIIFDYMEYPKNEQAQNLVAYDLEKNTIWVAEHPTNQRNDAYVHITSEKPLKANNFASYSCELNIDTGRIVNAEFYK